MRGYLVDRVVMAAIILSSGVSTLILVTSDEARILYAGVTIGVARVAFAGVASYIAAKGAEGD